MRFAACTISYTIDNHSIADSAVPVCMKMAIVTPILKKSNPDPADISNYRPVSNLSFLSKLLEQAIKQQLRVRISAAT